MSAGAVLVLLFVRVELMSQSFIQDLCGSWKIDKRDISTHKLWDNVPDIINVLQGFEQRDQFEQTSVIRVVIPGEDWNGILRMEEIRVGRVVNDDNVFHRPAEQGQVLDVRTHIIKAMLTVKPHGNQSVLV